MRAVEQLRLFYVRGWECRGKGLVEDSADDLNLVQNQVLRSWRYGSRGAFLLPPHSWAGSDENSGFSNPDPANDQKDNSVWNVFLSL